MPNPHHNVQSLGAGGMYGTNTVYGGGGQAVARSEMDESRMGVRRQPSAEYPAGYLGTIRSRRDDRGPRGDGDRAPRAPREDVTEAGGSLPDFLTGPRD